MSRERYAVVSCHVERPLDDEVWGRFSQLQRRPPGRFRIAALMRPPDAAAGEDEARWLERAREASARGPLGHHTHWTAPDHARPSPAGDAPAQRVRQEGLWIRDAGLTPKLFCGGGWYTDADVADACAELGYVDCTPRARRPPYLAEGEAWAALDAPARLLLPSRRVLLAIPTTHSIGDLGRATLGRSLPFEVVHVYFHDTDLLDRRRHALMTLLLGVLARRASVTDLDRLVAMLGDTARELAWDDVARL